MMIGFGGAATGKHIFNQSNLSDADLNPRNQASTL
jgi:hypothetical protein